MHKDANRSEGAFHMANHPLAQPFSDFVTLDRCVVS